MLWEIMRQMCLLEDSMSPSVPDSGTILWPLHDTEQGAPDGGEQGKGQREKGGPCLLQFSLRPPAHLSLGGEEGEWCLVSSQLPHQP